jgi:CBS domain-containing protein
MLAKNVMNKNVVWCTPETSLAEVSKLMRETNCGAIPVLAASTLKPLGMVTDRDIICRVLAKGRNPLAVTAGECMSANPVVVGLETPLEECIEKMKSSQIHRLIVVAPKGACQGIIAIADLAAKATRCQLADVVHAISESRNGKQELVGNL